MSLFCCGFADVHRLDGGMCALLTVGADEIDALSHYAVIRRHFAPSNLSRVAGCWSIATVLRELFGVSLAPARVNTTAYQIYPAMVSGAHLTVTD